MDGHPPSFSRFVANSAAMCSKRSRSRSPLGGIEKKARSVPIPSLLPSVEPGLRIDTRPNLEPSPSQSQYPDENQLVSLADIYDPADASAALALPAPSHIPMPAAAPAPDFPRKLPVNGEPRCVPATYVCHRCKNGGHHISECPLLEQPPPANYVCHSCKVSGHWRWKCPASHPPLHHNKACVSVDAHGLLTSTVDGTVRKIRTAREVADEAALARKDRDRERKKEKENEREKEKEREKAKEKEREREKAKEKERERKREREERERNRGQSLDRRTNGLGDGGSNKGDYRSDRRDRRSSRSPQRSSTLFNGVPAMLSVPSPTQGISVAQAPILYYQLGDGQVVAVPTNSATAYMDRRTNVFTLPTQVAPLMQLPPEEERLREKFKEMEMLFKFKESEMERRMEEKMEKMRLEFLQSVRPQLHSVPAAAAAAMTTNASLHMDRPRPQRYDSFGAADNRRSIQLRELEPVRQKERTDKMMVGAAQMGMAATAAVATGVVGTKVAPNGNTFEAKGGSRKSGSDPDSLDISPEETAVTVGKPQTFGESTKKMINDEYVTIEKLLRHIEEESKYFNGGELAMLMARILSLHQEAKGASRDAIWTLFRRRAEIVRQAVENVMLKSGLDQYAVTQMGFVYAKFNIRHQKFFAFVIDYLARDMTSFTMKALSLVAWSYATVGADDAKMTAQANKVFHQLSDVIIKQAVEIIKDSQSVSRLCWAYVKLCIMEPVLFNKLAAELWNSDRLDNMHEEHLCILVWAFGRQKVNHTAIFGRFAEIATRQMPKYTGHHLQMLSMGFAEIGYQEDGLFDLIAKSAIAQITFLNEEHLAMILWAFAGLLKLHWPLMTEFSKKIRLRLFGFNERSLALIAWSFATLNVLDLPLMTAIAEATIGREPRFTPQELGQLAWAYTKLSVRHIVLFARIATDCANRMTDFEGVALSNLVYAFSELDLFSELVTIPFPPPFPINTTDVAAFNSVIEQLRETRIAPANSLAVRCVDLLVRQCSAKISTLNRSSLAVVASGLAKMGHRDEKLFHEIERALIATYHKLRPNEPMWTAESITSMSKAIWAFGALYIQCKDLFALVNKALTDGQTATFTHQDLTLIAWAGIRLECVSQKLINTIVEVSLDELDTFTPSYLAMMAWTVAVHRVPDIDKILTKIIEICTPRLDKLDAKSLSMLAFAITYASVSPVIYGNLFKLIGEHSIPHMCRFDQEDISNLIYAFATIRWIDERLLASITKECLRIYNFTPQKLALLNWSLAVLKPAENRHHPIDGPQLPKLLAYLHHTGKLVLNMFAKNAVDVCYTSMLVWSYAKLGYRNDELMQLMVDNCIREIGQLSSSDIHNLGWGIANSMAYVPTHAITVVPQVATAVSTAVSTAVARPVAGLVAAPFDGPDALSTTGAGTNARAETKAVAIRIGRLFSAIAQRSLHLINEFDETQLANIAWAFAVFDYGAGFCVDGSARFARSPALGADEEADKTIERDEDNDEKVNNFLNAIIRQANNISVHSSAQGSGENEEKDGIFPMERRSPLRQFGLFEIWLQIAHPLVYSNALIRVSSTPTMKQESIFVPKLARDIKRIVALPSATPATSMVSLGTLSLIERSFALLRPNGDDRLANLKKNVMIGFANCDYVNVEARLIIQLAVPSALAVSDNNKGTVDGNTALVARLLRYSGYRVLYLAVIPLHNGVTLEALNRAVMTGDSAMVETLLATNTFVLSHRGVVVPRSPAAFLAANL